jgi:hypothetical protein
VNSSVAFILFCSFKALSALALAVSLAFISCAVSTGSVGRIGFTFSSLVQLIVIVDLDGASIGVGSVVLFNSGVSSITGVLIIGCSITGFSAIVCAFSAVNTSS